MSQDWEEIRRLAADFQRVQLSSAAEQLSEANCIEIVNKCIELGLVEVLYSSDGKEYITHEALRREIDTQVHYAGGRETLVNLASTLNVDLSRVESETGRMCKSTISDEGVTDSNLAPDEPAYYCVLGQLIHHSWIGQLCDDISDKLKAAGTMKWSDVTKSYDLPIEFVNKILTPKVGSAIDCQFDANDKHTLITAAHIKRCRGRVRGALIALDAPTPLTHIVKHVTEFVPGISAAFVIGLVRESLAAEEVAGSVTSMSLDGGLFVPARYAAAQQKWIDESLAQSGYIEFAVLKRLAVSDPRGYIVKRYMTSSEGSVDNQDPSPSVTPLVTLAVSTDKLVALVVTVSEALRQRGYVDLSSHLTLPCSTSDMKLIVVAIIEYVKSDGRTCLWKLSSYSDASVSDEKKGRRNKSATAATNATMNSTVFNKADAWDGVIERAADAEDGFHAVKRGDAFCLLVSQWLVSQIAASLIDDVKHEAEAAIADKRFEHQLAAWLAHHHGDAASVAPRVSAHVSLKVEVDVTSAQSKKDERRKKAAQGRAGGGAKGRETKTKSTAAKSSKGGNASRRGKGKGRDAHSESDDDVDDDEIVSDNDSHERSAAKYNNVSGSDVNLNSVTFASRSRLQQLIRQRHLEQQKQRDATDNSEMDDNNEDEGDARLLPPPIVAYIATRVAARLDAAMRSTLTDLYEARMMRDVHARRKAHVALVADCDAAYKAICASERGVVEVSHKLAATSSDCGRLRRHLLRGACRDLLAAVATFVVEHDNGTLLESCRNNQQQRQSRDESQWVDGLSSQIERIVDRAIFNSLTSLYRLTVIRETDDDKDAKAETSLTQFITQLPDVCRRCVDVSIKRGRERLTAYGQRRAASQRLAEFEVKRVAASSDITRRELQAAVADLMLIICGGLIYLTVDCPADFVCRLVELFRNADSTTDQRDFTPLQRYIDLLATVQDDDAIVDGVADLSSHEEVYSACCRKEAAEQS